MAHEPKNSARNATILLSAFACDPLHGSERYVGWRWAKMLSGRFAKVHVLTREFNREFHPPEQVPDNVEFTYFDLPLGGRRIHIVQGSSSLIMSSGSLQRHGAFAELQLSAIPQLCITSPIM
jgi:hypothetical protein